MPHKHTPEVLDRESASGYASPTLTVHLAYQHTELAVDLWPGEHDPPPLATEAMYAHSLRNYSQGYLSECHANDHIQRGENLR